MRYLSTWSCGYNLGKCMSLLHLISEKINAEGPLPFVDFMQMALYTPHEGYYQGNLQKFGQSGDFTTAPELTPLFGYALANQCADLLKELTNPIVFEFGAGSGRLCVDILKRLEHLDLLPDEYHILDVSRQLQARQQKLIQEEIPHLFDRIKWLSQWPTNQFNGVILANEVLDAMPVHRFCQTNDGLYELFVKLNDENELVEVILPCHNSELMGHVNGLPIKGYVPYQSEVNLFIDGWINKCHTMLNIGAMFVLDYGFPRREYYHPDRNQGTLMCHYRQRAHSDPLIHIGEQDITAHVDFTHVAEAAIKTGFQVAGYTNQAAFLLGNNLLNLVKEYDKLNKINTQQALKILLQPSEMGELFKVMALTKNIDVTFLRGFQLYDKRSSL